MEVFLTAMKEKKIEDWMLIFDDSFTTLFEEGNTLPLCLCVVLSNIDVYFVCN